MLWENNVGVVSKCVCVRALLMGRCRWGAGALDGVPLLENFNVLADVKYTKVGKFVLFVFIGFSMYTFKVFSKSMSDFNFNYSCTVTVACAHCDNMNMQKLNDPILVWVW